MGADPTVVPGVTAIVSRVLGRAEVDPTLSFERLGGTSLAAVHVVSLIEAEYQVAISLADFFAAPDLVAVADLVVEAGTEATAPRQEGIPRGTTAGEPRAQGEVARDWKRSPRKTIVRAPRRGVFQKGG